MNFSSILFSTPHIFKSLLCALTFKLFLRTENKKEDGAV